MEIWTRTLGWESAESSSSSWALGPEWSQTSKVWKPGEGSVVHLLILQRKIRAWRCLKTFLKCTVIKWQDQDSILKSRSLPASASLPGLPTLPLQTKLPSGCGEPKPSPHWLAYLLIFCSKRPISKMCPPISQVIGVLRTPVVDTVVRAPWLRGVEDDTGSILCPRTLSPGNAQPMQGRVECPGKAEQSSGNPEVAPESDQVVYTHTCSYRIA